ncbi:MAG: choline/carnitine O-acyltransferase [Candidatus Woesearchaeota archaeon]
MSVKHRYSIPLSQDVPILRLAPFEDYWSRFRETCISYHDSPEIRKEKEGFLSEWRPVFECVYEELSNMDNCFDGPYDNRHDFTKEGSDRSFLETSVVTLLEDSPQDQDPLHRSASLIIGAVKTYQTIQKECMMSTTPQKQPLDYSQYNNIFAKSFAVKDGQLRFTSSENPTHICLLYRGDVYEIEVLRDDQIISKKGLVTCLEDIVESSKDSSNSISVGDLSVTNVSEYLKQREVLDKVPQNKTLFSKLEGSLFVMSLDLDTLPSDDEQAARAIFSENYRNRFYYVPTQIVVLGNGQSGIISAFNADLDGNTIIQSASWMADNARNLDDLDAEYFDEAQRPRRLHFDFSSVDEGQSDVNGRLHQEQAVYEVRGIGKGLFKRYDLCPDSAVNVAIVWATRDEDSRLKNIYELIDMRQWSRGTLTFPPVRAQKIEEFVHKVQTQAGLSKEDKAALLREAVYSHRHMVTSARDGSDPFISLIFPTLSRLDLTERLRESVSEFWAAIRNHPAVYDMFVSDIVTSNISITDKLPYVKFTGRPGVKFTRGRLFAAHIIIGEDSIRFIYMPNENYVGQIGAIHKRIEQSLNGMKMVLE